MNNILKLSLLMIVPILFVTFQNFSPSLKVSANSERFKIIWHLGSAIERIADANDAEKKILNNLKGHVDGYYFLVLNNGSLLTYWKERPLECLINFKSLKWKVLDGTGSVEIPLDGKNFNQKTKEECAEALSNYQERLWVESGSKETFKNFQTGLHENALKRVLTTLDIKGEQAAGKKIMAEMILRSGERGDFFYNQKTDKLNLIESDDQLNLPKSYDFLRKNGIIVDRLMTYQEPRPQAENDSLLRVPLVKGGPTDYAPNEGGCKFCLPENLRVIDMVANAIEKENLSIRKMAINIRTWSSINEESITRLLNSNPNSKFDGINVEGNASKLNEPSYKKRVKAVAWMLKNTNRPVSFLVPGTVFEGETNSQKKRDDKYLEHFLTYINTFNQDLNRELALPAGKNSLCNPRISIIVGSYGSPLHMETLPLYRRDKDGNKTHQAGSVGSEIKILSQLRNRLCGRE